MSTPAELPDPYGTSSVKERLARFAAIGRAARVEQRARNAAYDWWYENIPPGCRVLLEEQCCELACPSGGCESCPCCWAGWCVWGKDLPGMTDGDVRQWLDVAVDYNPFAAFLQTILLAAPDVDLSFALERARQKGPTQ